MSLKIAIEGLGWATPFGADGAEILRRVAAHETAPVAQYPASTPEATPRHYIPAPTPDTGSLARLARIRRSGPISYFALAAGLNALADAGLPAPSGSGTAVIFAICSGGVQYTRRLYDQIVRGGPPAASPLLFPETVHNAPASHLAAALGLDHESYTLVGDGSVGLSALAFAGELLACRPALERCIVVGSEESDWILWEGYQTWRLCSREPQLHLHQTPPRGMLLSEGAAAVIVRRPDGLLPEVETATGSYLRRRNASGHLARVLAQLPLEGSELLVGSANGTWVDHAEATALQAALPQQALPALYPKGVLGDALGASALIQTGLALRALRAQGGGKALVTSLGLNQQLGAAVVTAPRG